MSQIRNILEEGELVRVFIQRRMQEDVHIAMSLEQIFLDRGSGQFESSGTSDDANSQTRRILGRVGGNLVRMGRIHGGKGRILGGSLEEMGEVRLQGRESKVR